MEEGMLRSRNQGVASFFEVSNTRTGPPAMSESGQSGIDT